MEKWNTASFDINQTVSGLPNGFYRVSVQGFYRVGGGANNPLIAADEYTAGTPTLNAIFYANEASKPLMSIMAEAKTDADSLTEKYYNVDLTYGYKTDLGVVPHCQHGAAHFFSEGLYTQSIVAEVVDGTLKVGVKKDVESTNDWVVFDNFKLEYAGTSYIAGTTTVELEEGTPYYLKHVSTGLYLEGGNSWGTQASLGSTGVDVSFANIATSLSGIYGIFTVDTKVSNFGYTQTGAPQYLALDADNGNVYLDQNAQNRTVTRLDNGNYTLKCNDGRYLNSAEETSALTLGNFSADSEWQLVTKEERLADLPIEDASELFPVDLTFMLPGAGINQNDLRNENWVGGLAIGGSYENRNAEKWNTASFDINQTVSGLPNGFYRVYVQGFYRVGGGENNPTIAANEYAAGSPTLNAIFYANEANKPLMSIMADARTDADSLTEKYYNDLPYGYKTDLGVVPHCQDGASYFFNRGFYTQSLIAKVVDGTLKVGVKKDVASTNDWVVFDNFKLEYVGTESVTGAFTVDLKEGTPYYLKHVATGLYLEGGNSWGTQASLGSAGVDVSFANVESSLSGVYGIFTIDTKVSNLGYTEVGAPQYLALDATNGNVYLDQDIQNWTVTRLANGNYTLKCNDGRYLNSIEGSTALVLGELSAESEWQMVTKEDRLTDLNIENANELSPVDLTFMLPGAGFNQNDTRNENWVGEPQFGGPYENRNVEKWNTASFDINQTVSGLPNGYYRISVQGFYRVGGDGTNHSAIVSANEYAAGNPTLNAIFYANEASKPLMSIAAEAKADADSLATSSDGYKTDLGVVPNSQLGAAIFFNEGLYTQSIIAEVVDGTLKVGVKKEVDAGDDWTIFDNFELWYMGTETPELPDTPEVPDTPTHNNTFVLNDTTLRAGQSMLLPVALNNENEFTAFQCDIYLPEGITLQTNKGKYDITLDEERMNDQTISSALQEDGSIRMAVASLTSSLFSGNNGNLFYLNLLGGEDISGELAISIKNIHISAVDGTMYDLEDVTATITVPSYTPADVNDDGVIAINDVVLTINALLGTYADNFVFAAADMNGDNQIMIGDVVQVINSVLGLNTTSVLTARNIVRETLDITETQNGFGMSLSNAGGYVAMQYDMTLPAGVSINDIRVTAGSNHSVSFSEVGDGQVRVAVVSLTNEAFASNGLIEVSVNAETATNITITNAYVATRNGVMVEVADAEALLTRGGATGIQTVGANVAPADIFDLSGRIVKKAATSLEGLDKGVYLMNGKKVVVK